MSSRDKSIQSMRRMSVACLRSTRAATAEDYPVFARLFPEPAASSATPDVMFVSKASGGIVSANMTVRCVGSVICARKPLCTSPTDLAATRELKDLHRCWNADAEICPRCSPHRHFIVDARQQLELTFSRSGFSTNAGRRVLGNGR